MTADGTATPISPAVRLAHLLDSRFRIPGTPIRFGLDAIIGLVPGLGDVVTGGLSLIIVLDAARLDAPKVLLARMVVNILLDMLIGAIPLLGDVADVFFKANLRNVRLLERWTSGARGSASNPGSEDVG